MKAKLVIVADLGLVKAFKLTRTRLGSLRLQLLEELILEDARQRLVETVTDFAGQRAGPTHMGWGAPVADPNHLEV